MKKSPFILLLICFTFINCGTGNKTIAIEPENGLFIKISELHFSKSQGRVLGYVQIENRTSSFVRVSNQELILYCSSDTARAFMRMSGNWEIDKGLVNIMKGKSLSYQAAWPLTKCEISDIKATYAKFLSRDSE
jgi:hypothetical protein